jgi:hypothetical protein
MDHEAVDELHGLGTLTSQLAGDHDLATLGSGLHDETEDTVAGPENGLGVNVRITISGDFDNFRWKMYVYLLSKNAISSYRTAII